jgi:acyl-coenzyme A synthetase/AMP-(fatty) acid ligase
MRLVTVSQLDIEAALIKNGNVAKAVVSTNDEMTNQAVNAFVLLNDNSQGNGAKNRVSHTDRPHTPYCDHGHELRPDGFDWWRRMFPRKKLPQPWSCRR